MASRRTSQRGEDLTSTLTRIIGAIDVVKNVVPVQLGQGILASTSAILLIVKDTVKNKHDFRDLIGQCDWIRDLIQRSSSLGLGGGGMGPALSDAMKELSIEIDRIHEEIAKKNERKFSKRFWSSSIDKDKIKDWTTGLDRSLKYFALRLDMTMVESLHKVEQELLSTRREALVQGASSATQPMNPHAPEDSINSSPPSPPPLTCQDSGLPVPFLRAYQPYTADHFYSTDPAEYRNAVTKLGYRAEDHMGRIFTSQQTSTVPLYRLYSPHILNHFYTTSASERDNAVYHLQYIDEDVAGYLFATQDGGTVPLYRLYHLGRSDHFYTLSAAERDNAIHNLGFTDEGIAGYVLQCTDS